MKNRVFNSICLDKNNVWVLKEGREFSYSDGRSVENYLAKVLRNTKDLSSRSDELQNWIKDWPSEYHLSPKRVNLLRGFDFSQSKKVLEVGCGCGAITRFLGENFTDVTAIEGSYERAKLARMRTKGLQNVHILNAPFQEIKFKEEFDFIFCIGVFEYSNAFVDADDPYDSILEYFSRILTPEGVLVLAIENQFGLKYFCSSTEDHTQSMFDGIEGYPRYGNWARTFGYTELSERLEKYFSARNFYFPFPDYKLPRCVISEKMLGKVSVGGLVGRFSSKDYIRWRAPLFNEGLAWVEIDKNHMVHFFANSFLVAAGKSSILSPKHDWLCVFFSDHPRKEFQTITKVYEDAGAVWIEKKLLNNRQELKRDKLVHRSYRERWVQGQSLQLRMAKRAKERGIALEELVEPSFQWFTALRSKASMESGEWWIDGAYLDSNWSNCYVENGECVFIDQEWIWQGALPLKVMVTRSLYYFLKEIRDMQDLNPAVFRRSMWLIIKRCARLYGLNLALPDCWKFLIFEAKLQHIVAGDVIIFRILKNTCVLTDSVGSSLIVRSKYIYGWVSRNIIYKGIRFIRKYTPRLN